jgi:hypothetical protein
VLAAWHTDGRTSITSDSLFFFAMSAEEACMDAERTQAEPQVPPPSPPICATHRPREAQPRNPSHPTRNLMPWCQWRRHERAHSHEQGSNHDPPKSHPRVACSFKGLDVTLFLRSKIVSSVEHLSRLRQAQRTISTTAGRVCGMRTARQGLDSGASPHTPALRRCSSPSSRASSHSHGGPVLVRQSDALRKGRVDGGPCNPRHDQPQRLASTKGRKLGP